MKDVRVSVVIPTYKRSERLAQAIDSVLNQTYPNLEVIVVDDNDPDTNFRHDTQALMEKYRGNQRVKYIQHERNKNGAAARNTGIRCAQGEFIAFLDDDDLFYPEKIEKQVSYMDQHPEYAGVYCGRYQKGKEIIGNKAGDLSKEILTGEFTPTTPALLFRKDALENIGGFDESFRRHQDYELLLKYFLKYDLGVIEEALVEIGQNEGENELHGKELENTKERFLNQFHGAIINLEKKYPGTYKNVYVNHYRAVFFDHLSTLNFNRAAVYYFKGIRVSFIKFNVSVIKYATFYAKRLINKRLNRIHL